MAFGMISLISSFHAFVFLSLSYFCRVQAKVHYYDFFIKETNFTRLCSTKSIPTINDSFPGPVIQVQKGDTAYVNVYNHGDYGVTLHWHGVKQPRNPWSDGPEFITQCPISPGTNFTYEIIFSTEEGTLWWHAHSDWTRSTVHGAIVVLPADGNIYPFPKPDEEVVIVLGSWFKGDVMTLMKKALHSGDRQKLSDSYLINGQPGDFFNCSKDSTYRLNVEYGKTYLLRIVNALQDIDLFFAIAEHNLTVVGWDASYIKAVTTSYIMIAPGQTMDVLVTANQSQGGQYYMLASPYFDGDDFDESIASGILQYAGNYTPTSTPIYPSTIPSFYDIGAAWSYVVLLKSLANKEHPIEVPLNVTTRLYVTLSVNMLQCPNETCYGPAGNRLAAAANNQTFANPSLDILQAYYRNLSGIYESDFPDQPPNFYNFTADLEADNVTLSRKGTKVKVLNYNETVEIVFQGTNVMNAGGNHPIHLHGFKFYVVGIGKGNFNSETDPLKYNLVDPPEANTVAVPKVGWATIRFKASNPGVWFMHCHYDHHMSWGMDTVFIVKNGGTEATSVRPPPDYMPPCEALSLSKSGLQKEE